MTRLHTKSYHKNHTYSQQSNTPTLSSEVQKTQGKKKKIKSDEDKNEGQKLLWTGHFWGYFLLQLLRHKY